MFAKLEEIACFKYCYVDYRLEVDPQVLRSVQLHVHQVRQIQFQKLVHLLRFEFYLGVLFKRHELSRRLEINDLWNLKLLTKFTRHFKINCIT